MGTSDATPGARRPPPVIDPSLWTANAVLGDGETVSIRPIRPDDAPRLLEFHHRQSPDSIFRRYFSPKPELSPRELERFTTVDLVDRAGLVVESHGEMLGWASYERWPGRDDADTAFMVDDANHGKGVATLMLEHLAAIATSNGIERFTAEVLGENRAMLSVFARAGWPLQRRYDRGVIEVDFPIAETPEFVDSVARREQRADSRAMARMLLPRAIAVVGATDRPGSVGNAVWRSVAAAASVPVFAVNPNRRELGDVEVFPSVADIRADVSLAVIVVPAEALATAIADCAAARVRGAVVITSVQGSTVDLDAVVAEARSNGMRIIGPSSMGVASSDPRIGLSAALFAGHLLEGNVAISLQSGPLAASFLELARRLQIGLSWFVSLGDRADVSGNDLLQFWEDDDPTTVIGMYTENLGNPRRFARIARRVSLHRPIVAVRAGVEMAPANSALYRHCGLIEVPTVADLLDTVRVLSSQPVLRGDRIAVIANFERPPMLMDALDSAGLRSVEPPLQLDFRATGADFAAAIRAAVRAGDVDGVLVVYAPPLADAVGAPIDDIDEAAAGSPKPVCAVLAATSDGPIRPGSPVPNFMFPEPAAAVLGRCWAYGRWLATEAGASPAEIAGVDTGRVDELLTAAIAAGRTQLDPATTAEVLDAYGIAMPPTRFVAAADAVKAAEEVGYPVAVKARVRRPGRSVLAGVALDLLDSSDVEASVATMSHELGDDADFVVVQRMTSPGVDLRIHGTADDQAGPLMSVGIGGIQADLLDDDEPLRLAPLSPPSATDLVATSRAGQALAQAGIGSASFADTLTRAAQLVADHAEVAALDLNPVITTVEGCSVTDAVITVRATPRPTAPLRRL